MRYRVFALVLATLLLAAHCPISTAYAAPDSGGGVMVFSFEQLATATNEAQGIIVLGDNITVPAGEELYLYETEIRTGEYSLIAEGSIVCGYDVAISGEGTSGPVIDIKSGGILYLHSADYNSRIRISAATGGGPALIVRAGGEYITDPSTVVQITAPNGTAIESEVSLIMQKHIIQARRGIVSSADVSMFLCNIDAADASVQAPDTFADTCVLSPLPDGSFAGIHRKISSINLNYIMLGLGDDLGDDWGSHMRSTLWLRAAGVDDEGITDFITLTAPSLDTSKPGDYPAAVAVSEWLRPFDLIDASIKLYTIKVRDLTVPVFDELGTSGGTYILHYSYLADDMKGLTLWRSDDEGESWYDATADTDISFMYGVLSIFLHEPSDHSVLFAWALKGRNVTETVRVKWDGYDPDAGVGGDRSGIDRGEVLPPPSGIGDDLSTSGTGESTSSDTGGAVPYGFGGVVGGAGIAANGGRINPAALPDFRAAGGSGSPTTMANPRSTAPAAVDVAVIIPTPSPSPAIAAALPTAPQAESGLAVSGERLLIMMEANPSNVSLQHDGLWISIPTGYLLALDIKETDIFHLRLEWQGEDTFFVALLPGGVELPYAFDEPLLVSIPWNGGGVSCASESGNVAIADIRDGKAIFALTETGSYRLIPIAENSPALTAPAAAIAIADPYDDSFLPIAAACSGGVLGVAAVWGCLRRRRLIR